MTMEQNPNQQNTSNELYPNVIMIMNSNGVIRRVYIPDSNMDDIRRLPVELAEIYDSDDSGSSTPDDLDIPSDESTRPGLELLDVVIEALRSRIAELGGSDEEEDADEYTDLPPLEDDTPVIRPIIAPTNVPIASPTQHQPPSEFEDWQVWCCGKGDPIKKHKCLGRGLSRGTAEQNMRAFQDTVDIKYIDHKLKCSNCKMTVPEVYMRRLKSPAFHVWSKYGTDIPLLYATVYDKNEAERIVQRIYDIHATIHTGGVAYYIEVDESRERGEMQVVD